MKKIISILFWFVASVVKADDLSLIKNRNGLPGCNNLDEAKTGYVISQVELTRIYDIVSLDFKATKVECKQSRLVKVSIDRFVENKWLNISIDRVSRLSKKKVRPVEFYGIIENEDLFLTAVYNVRTFGRSNKISIMLGRDKFLSSYSLFEFQVVMDEKGDFKVNEIESKILRQVNIKKITRENSVKISNGGFWGELN